MYSNQEKVDIKLKILKTIYIHKKNRMLCTARGICKVSPDLASINDMLLILNLAARSLAQQKERIMIQKERGREQVQNCT